MKVLASSGSLSDIQVEQLRKVLDSNELAKLEHNARPADWSREGESTQLVIPRASRIQTLRFVDSFGVPGNPREIGGLTGNTTQIDHEAHLIQPVRKWLKNNIEGTHLAPILNAAATNCAPDH